MDLDIFRRSLKDPAPPAGMAPPLRALWWDARGDWARAHEAAQAEDGPAGAWVHAYLHRKEGDLANARYWYRAARQPPAEGPLEEEHAAILAALLADGRNT